MIEIIKSPSAANFYGLVKASNKELLFCAPFIKKEIIADILKFKKKDVALEIITSANVANFVSGSLDVDAIKMLLNNNIRVLNYQNLHAKIYLFDNKKALITSANLTSKALYQNYEYGVLIDEKEQSTINEVYADFVNMMDSELCGEFNLKIIERIEKIIENYNGQGFIKIDENEDEILSIDEKLNLQKHLSPWEKDVFDCLNLIDSNDFCLQDIYKYEKYLQSKHPNNNNVKPKIRQILQNLRDLGFVKFVAPGSYKKLWLNMTLESKEGVQVSA